MTIFFIAPHLSTGGMPQYLYKQIEALYKEHTVYCLEWDDVTGGNLVVQRNRIKNLLGSRLITLDQDKHHLFKLIEEYNPDVIHLQEIPEMFMPFDVADKFYSINRKYKIVETSHDSSFDINRKLYFPDKFMMVSQYQVETYKPLNIPIELVEYPIEYKKRTNTREELLNKLGLDPNKKHVINVGLFTPRKNQAEVIEYARMLKDYPIQFHFIGNQADNFQQYWQPLMKDFPSNCKWWGERSDVDTFFEMADLFLFTSRGHATDKETMPLVIREAISWKTPTLIFNLDVYLDYFDKFSNIDYLDFNSKGQNIKSILNKVGMEINKVDEFFDIFFDASNNKINFNYKKQERNEYKISVKDKDSNAPIYWTDTAFELCSSMWVIPIPIHAFDFYKDPHFGSFLIEFYDLKNNLVFDKTLFIKNAKPSNKFKLDLKNPFDCLFNNYNEMFVDNKYDCYELDKMETVFDVGANSGLFSILAIKKGAKKVYAFEPNQESLINLKQLVKNQNVKVIDKAVYTKDEDLIFYIDPSNTTIGSISEDHIINNGSKVEKITVSAVSLKTFFEQNNIERLSLLKMDIEGAEYDIIENLEPEVFNKIDNFLIEYHNNYNGEAEKLINKLVKAGYDIDQIRNQNTANNEDIKDRYTNSVIGTIFAKKSLKEKLLTVIIPTHNHEKYVEKTIDSVLRQKTLFNFNVIISDDKSTDNTYEVIQKYKDILNVTILRNETNLGPTPKMAYNVISKTKSEYVTILDGDDFYTDDYKLQKQVNFLQRNLEYSIHCTGYYQLEKDNVDEVLPSFNLYGLKEEVILRDQIDHNCVSYGFMFRNPILKYPTFPEWYFDKDIFDGYWALGLLMLQYGKCKNEKWPSGVYRVTPNGHFGEKSIDWKEEQGAKQRLVHRQNFKIVNKQVLVDKSDINLFDVYNGHFKVQYKGVPYLKCPMDYVLYQMLIMDIKPDLIIEIGTLNGGGALYYADLLYLLGKGQVHTINLYNEVYDQKVLDHGQIKFFYGGFDAYDIEQNTKGFDKILVIDDAAHTYEDVLKALNKFHKVVSKESYFIVEDGVVSFTGVADNYGGGPRKAIDEFLQTNNDFIVDRSLCDFFGTNATFNPDGYLKRIK
jgi:FkbM family methyltransferase